MEEKLKKKRRRRIALIIVAVVIIGAVIAGLKFEYADYGKVLNEEVSKAEKLAKDADIGNQKGQYAKYTVLDFQIKVDTAKKTAEDSSAEYDRQKAAYETLKADMSTFEKSTNSDCLGEDEINSLISSKESKKYKIALSKSKNLTWTVDGSKIKKATPINLMAKSESPYSKKMSEYAESLKLQGTFISFYQDGSFGGSLSAYMPIYSEENATGYVYRYDVKEETLTYTTSAKIEVVKDREPGSGDAFATFDVSEGGDYMILLKKIKSSDGVEKKTVDKKDVEEAEKKNETVKKSDDNKTSTENNDNTKKDESKDDNQASNDDDKKISVTITIENTTYSGHRSDIISKMTYKCDPGSTVYDVLYTVTRNKGVQMESEYTPAYGSYYVKAIDSLYEFDGGPQSGWMYKVNGQFPNYGCSSYTLKGGENIVWLYTCDLGKDVGDNR